MDKKTKDKVRHVDDSVIIILYFTAMPAIVMAIIWLSGFVPTHVNDWFTYLPMRLTEYLAFPGFILGIVIMLLPICLVIGLINVTIKAIWRHLFGKGDD